MATKRNRRIPSYRLHKSSGRAVVTIDGRDYFLGRHGTEESHQRYNQLIGEWLSHGCRMPITAHPHLTVLEVIATFWHHAKRYYTRIDGSPTTELSNYRLALRELCWPAIHTTSMKASVRSSRAPTAAPIALSWMTRGVSRPRNSPIDINDMRRLGPHEPRIDS